MVQSKKQYTLYMDVCAWQKKNKNIYFKPLLDSIVSARILLWISHTDHLLILKQEFIWAVARTQMHLFFEGFKKLRSRRRRLH